nr:immunoglobulin light chain junction region [Macaca mulatta]
GQHYYNTPLTC